MLSEVGAKHYRLAPVILSEVGAHALPFIPVMLSEVRAHYRLPPCHVERSRSALPSTPVMLSEVGAHATTKSKHPGAVGCHNANTGRSTEIAHSDTLLRKQREPGENSLNLRFSARFSGCFDSETQPSARLSAQHDRCRGSGSPDQAEQKQSTSVSC
jgi:hypothetical protein